MIVKKTMNVFQRPLQGPTLPQPERKHLAIKRTKEYLDTHYAEAVTLQELANVANLSPFHLNRVFRQAITFGDVPP